MQFKKDDLKYANENSNRSVAKKLKVDEERVRKWKGQKKEITATNSARQRLTKGVKELIDNNLEQNLLTWIFDRRGSCLCI